MKKVTLNNNPETTITIDEFDKDKIYLSRTSTSLYKLNRISSKWAFVSLINSFGTSTGIYDKASDALKSQMHYGDVYEFDTLVEAIKELL